MASPSAPTVAISPKEFKDIITQVIPPAEELDGPIEPLSESIFDRIRTALDLAGKLEWSKRPRTYAVLLIIDRLDAMDYFVNAGLLDTQFPYSESRIPPPLMDRQSKSQFLKAQSLVLSKATDIENGIHKYFGMLPAGR
jgi:hypothetical protein